MGFISKFGLFSGKKKIIGIVVILMLIVLIGCSDDNITNNSTIDNTYQDPKLMGTWSKIIKVPQNPAWFNEVSSPFVDIKPDEFVVLSAHPDSINWYTYGKNRIHLCSYKNCYSPIHEKYLDDRGFIELTYMFQKDGALTFTIEANTWMGINQTYAEMLEQVSGIELYKHIATSISDSRIIGTWKPMNAISDTTLSMQLSSDMMTFSYSWSNANGSGYGMFGFYDVHSHGNQAHVYTAAYGVYAGMVLSYVFRENGAMVLTTEVNSLNPLWTSSTHLLFQDKFCNIELIKQ